MIYFFIGIFTVVGISIAIYYILAFLKGKLELELARDAAHSEELISGTVSLMAKQQIHGRLLVSLVGRDKQKQRHRDGDTTTEWVEVYRYDHVLEEKRDFQAGFQQRYTFDLLAPTRKEVNARGAKLEHLADAAGKEAVKGVLKMASGVAGSLTGKVAWHVETRLDAKGVDLYAKEKCTVNLN